MTQIKRRRNKRIVTVVSLVSVVIIAAGIAVAIALRDDTTVVNDSVAVSPPSVFTFDSSNASGWTQGATNEVSMAVFGSGSARACFISAEYKPGVADVAAALAEVQSGNERAGYVTNVIEHKALQLNVNGTPAVYELHQMNAMAQPGASPVKTGQALGYVQLADGYITLLSMCDTPAQRVLTYDALSAINYRE